MASLLDKFRSISRPSLTPSSGAFSSIARKSASAEDLLMDIMYSEGNVSLSAYQNHLNTRLIRPWNTPRQIVSISEKMEDVNEAIVDAEVSRAHDAGEISTRARYEYENEKLSNMREPGSTAFIKQTQLVQSLLDSSEKQERSSFRIQQLNELSKMPEDTSERLWQKASIYDTLAQQARLDGDEQQALSLDTQKNNYTNSAQKAEINDRIIQSRLAVSETPTAGRGVPSAEEGAKIAGDLTGGTAPPTGDTGTSLTGFTGTSSATSSALERLDRQQKTLERLYQQREDKSVMIQAYQEAVAASSGDQQTQLTIALNNLIDDIGGIDNSIANTTSSVEDTIDAIQEARQKAAATAFNQERRLVERELAGSEDELETAFKDGEISKNEYVAKGIMLSQTKAEFFDQVSSAYNEFGNDSSADSYLEKAEDMVGIHESLINVGQNIDDYEPIFTDSESPLTNLLGEKTNRGDVVLQDMRNLKQSGRFEDNYSLLDGVYHKVYYPPEFTEDGFLNTGISGKELAKVRDNAFINVLDDTGKMMTENVKFVQFKDENGDSITRPVPERNIQGMVDTGQIIEDAKKGFIQAPPPSDGSGLLKVAAGSQRFLEKNVPGLKKVRESFEEKTQEFGDKTPIGKVLDIGKGIFETTPLGAISDVVDLGKNMFNTVTDFFGVRRETEAGETGGFGIPSIVGTARAAEPVTAASAINNAAEKYAPGDEDFKSVLNAIALAESGGDPNAIGDNGQSIGLFQNRMKLGRGADYSKEQLLDPEFNANLAASDLINHYNNGKELGLSGRELTEHVSKFGQRPAAGNERFAGDLFGKFVSGAEGVTRKVADFFGRKQEQERDIPVAPTQQELDTTNTELALGLQRGDLGKGVTPSQEAIDKGFRSNDETRNLLRSAGYQPTGKVVDIPRPEPSQPSAPQRQTFDRQPSQVQSFFDIFKPKMLSPIPEAPRPSIPQLAVNTLGDIGKGIGTAAAKVVPPRLNIAAQARALPEFGRKIVAPKIKSFFSRFNPFD